MDKELLAKTVLQTREFIGWQSAELDGNVLDEMWESKTSPSDAVKQYSQMIMNLKALLGYFLSLSQSQISN
ncbi:hypothetical protein OH492_06360 [Vibrio chagasii]|nr:hypothetical protein [Vibrio chagasii]